MAGDFDFMCINNDKSLAPIIMPGDVIALKKLATWKTYIPGDLDKTEHVPPLKTVKSVQFWS